MMVSLVPCAFLKKENLLLFSLRVIHHSTITQEIVNLTLDLRISE